MSWSPYNYVANNPIQFIDPNGKEIKNPHASSVLTAKGFVEDAQKALETSMTEVIRVESKRIIGKSIIKKQKEVKINKEQARMKKRMFRILLFLCISILKGDAQTIDTLKMVYKVKADLLGYSRDCPSIEWYNSYFREAYLPIQFLASKGLRNVSLFSLDCQQTRNAQGIRTCDYFNLYGKLLFYYDHLTRDLYCINAFTDASQAYLRQLFVDRNLLAPSVLSEIVESKTYFLAHFEIESVNMEDLFLFLKDGKKSAYHSFGVIQW